METLKELKCTKMEEEILRSAFNILLFFGPSDLDSHRARLALEVVLEKIVRTN